MNRENSPVRVEFNDVKKSYGGGPLVLNGVDMVIEAGELVTVLGPSGCGKTTTLRLLAGFEHCTEGDILVGGKSILDTPANKRDMGMVFQSYSLFPNLTVRDNIEYGLRIRKMGATERRNRSEELLQLVSLGGFGDRYPHQLSGGQQQRVALARALAIQPQVLLLDEPLSALDATVRAQLRDEIRRIQQDAGITTMFVTHDQSEALVLGDKVAVMNEGRVEQMAPPQQLYDRPENPMVARFIGTMNEVWVPEQWREGEPLPIRLEYNGHGDVLFVRPEELVVRMDPSGKRRVTQCKYLGERVQVLITTPENQREPIIASVTPREAADLTEGTPVSVELTGRVALRLPAREAAKCS